MGIAVSANGWGSGLSRVVVEAGTVSCNPLLDLAQDLMAEMHLVPQFPHDVSWLHTANEDMATAASQDAGLKTEAGQVRDSRL